MSLVYGNKRKILIICKFPKLIKQLNMGNDNDRKLAEIIIVHSYI